MNKTVASVFDDIKPHTNQYGTTYYVNCMFTDDSVGSVGRKDEEAAELVHRQLQDAIGEALDFTVEDAGTSQTGRQKWKITGFGPPGGAATYTAPGVQGSGGSGAASPASRGGRPPEHDVDASIRASVAGKMAAEVFSGFMPKSTDECDVVLDVADYFDAWLATKASEPASSEYPQPVVADASGSASTDHQAGVGSEELPQENLSSHSAPAVGAMGEGDATEGGSSEVETPSPSHIHDWQPHPNLRGKLKCECGEMRNKASFEKELAE